MKKETYVNILAIIITIAIMISWFTVMNIAIEQAFG